MCYLHDIQGNRAWKVDMCSSRYLFIRFMNSIRIWRWHVKTIPLCFIGYVYMFISHHADKKFFRKNYLSQA